MMDYGLLMRRVMVQLALVADGATAQLSHARAKSDHDSKILSSPALILASSCQKCHTETGGRRYCPSCGTETEIVYASTYWLQDRWYRAHSTERKRQLLALALGLLRAARERKRQKLDMGTREGRLELGRLVLVGELSVRQAMEIYGYQRRRIYQLREEARKDAERQAEEALAWQHLGPLEDRTSIAATPSSLTSAVDREKVDETV